MVVGVVVLLLVGVVALLAATMHLSGRGEYGAGFLAAAWGTVVVGIATMVVLYRKVEAQ